jgi:hypothetical protein
MLELIDTNPDIDVQESEFKRLLGYPNGYELDGRSRELADWARQWYGEHGRPWTYVREANGLSTNDGHVRIDGAVFSSKRLHSQMAYAIADNAVLVAVSAGKQCEEKAQQLWQEEKPDEYFFLEIYGSAVTEHLIATASFRVCEWADQHKMAALPHYSPGYSGWDISDQKRIFDLIQQKRSFEFPEEIQVLDTGMLQPKKSLLAVFGITSHLDKVRRPTELIPCENCCLLSCQYRRVPYKHYLPQIEDVRRLQDGTNRDRETTVKRKAVLDSHAKYSTNVRALQKWSQERLELKIMNDRSVEARFRYEGTTCTNLGRPLEFEYHVKLSPSEDDYRIVDASCAPAFGDTGHIFMCEYLNNPEALMASIAREKPLLGRPLNDVLTWKRQQNPSGCYCAQDSREHKWGLVLEVLHHALVQLERSKGQQW